jgi:hypothetical protein
MCIIRRGHYEPREAGCGDGLGLVSLNFSICKAAGSNVADLVRSIEQLFKDRRSAMALSPRAGSKWVRIRFAGVRIRSDSGPYPVRLRFESGSFLRLGARCVTRATPCFQTVAGEEGRRTRFAREKMAASAVHGGDAFGYWRVRLMLTFRADHGYSMRAVRRDGGRVWRKPLKMRGE